LIAKRARRWGLRFGSPPRRLVHGMADGGTITPAGLGRAGTAALAAEQPDQPVDLADQTNAPLTGLDIAEPLLQCRALHDAPGGASSPCLSGRTMTGG